MSILQSQVHPVSFGGWGPRQPVQTTSLSPAEVCGHTHSYNPYRPSGNSHPSKPKPSGPIPAPPRPKPAPRPPPNSPSKEDLRLTEEITPTDKEPVKPTRPDPNPPAPPNSPSGDEQLQLSGQVEANGCGIINGTVLHGLRPSSFVVPEVDASSFQMELLKPQVRAKASPLRLLGSQHDSAECAISGLRSYHKSTNQTAVWWTCQDTRSLATNNLAVSPIVERRREQISGMVPGFLRGHSRNCTEACGLNGRYNQIPVLEVC